MNAEPNIDLDLSLRALADSNRRSILNAIRSNPLPVGSIAETVGLSQQTTSHHLGVLRKAGLTVGVREGTRHMFAIDTNGLTAVRSYLDDFWPNKLSKLKDVIEAREEPDTGRGENRG